VILFMNVYNVFSYIANSDDVPGQLLDFQQAYLFTDVDVRRES
jgi:hypothetical protein